MPYHTVRQGECLSSIAAEHRLTWRTLWNHPENLDLRRLRKDPNILYPGDRVFIPERTVKEESGSTGQVHRFRLRGTPARLRIRYLRRGEPQSGVPWQLVIDSMRFRGTTDDQGMLVQNVPPTAREGRLTFSGTAEYRLRIRHLDPIETISGIQARLNNLGYGSGPVDGIIGPITRGAVRRFQADHPPLVVDGIPGPRTQARLKEVYGC